MAGSQRINERPALHLTINIDPITIRTGHGLPREPASFRHEIVTYL